MLDFFIISTKSPKRGVIEVFPKFITRKSKDLMVRGGDFYAVWVEDIGLWSTDEDDVITLIDRELDQWVNEHKSSLEGSVQIHYMWDASSGSIDSWHKYCQKQVRDNFHNLDEKLIFSNTPAKRSDYASKRLSYPLEISTIDAYDELMSVLYSPEERLKIEWAIGAIVTGDSKKLQKFLVLYGAAGTGKSTVLNIIQELFDGYYAVFDAKALGSSSREFALEPLKDNPLVAIQHDGDLSRIEDNTRLNSLVSHEMMSVNTKYSKLYSTKFNSFLLLGTNRPVKITDAKSGLIRRLIDVTPSGNKIPATKYKQIMKQIEFELGGIACHCRDVYLENKHVFDDYIPLSMMSASNDFYNFVMESYTVFKKENGTTLQAAWEMYKQYCEDAKVPYPLSRMMFQEELKNYFWDFKERVRSDTGRLRNVYSGFRVDRFQDRIMDISTPTVESWLKFDKKSSLFDEVCKDCPAQYATSKETPTKAWDKVTETLKDLNTDQLHYVKVPVNHIVIDFDIPDENGNKCFEKNLEAASKWPKTYAELSKSGQGIHLHYIYTGGDPELLYRIYEEHVEVKVFNGGSSLRRKLTLCNDIPISSISSGLKVKEEERKVFNADAANNEKKLRSTILKILRKEANCPGTKSSIDLIDKIVKEAYDSGMRYDIHDLFPAIWTFACNSSNSALYCMKIVNNMKLCSEEAPETTDYEGEDIVFYDIEVFPNLLLINYKYRGGETMYRMINPSPKEIETLIKHKLVGFNCRKYDNHILHARLMGYDNPQIYDLSQKIVSGDRNAMFSQAYDYSYTDIYDFASSGNKKSLKKLEIEMGFHHQELGLPWDQPVPEEMWPKVSEYCDNDVLATEAAFDYLEADWTARQILADLAEMNPNTPTNTLTTRIIFGKERNPQGEFCYRNLAEPVLDLDPDVEEFLKTACPVMMSKRHGEAGSLLPYFPGYSYDKGVSTYCEEIVGEGGYVYAEPGIYVDVALLDITSMHPHSAIAECLFGPKFTTAFRDIVEGRVSIKHEAWDVVNEILDGKLKKYIQKVIDGYMTSKQLANALKTAINSVYGLTSAKFDNAFKDRRNVDNIVAKRGALFMINLKHEVQKRGFKVAHIKTDSIKIPNATPEIIQFVMDYGEQYGYTFEHEATYERMCLVNDAVYIARYSDGHWTATGKQFAVPYVFKTLFSKEKVEFSELCEIINVTKGALYLDTNEKLPDISEAEKAMSKLEDQYKKGLLSDILFENHAKPLAETIASGHDYHFIGRIGQFCPMKIGCDSAELMCLRDGKYVAPPGTKGWRWMESEVVHKLGLESYIDMDYYNKLVTDAVHTIAAYGDFERFVSDEPYENYVNKPYEA